jgi:ribonuclease D
VLGHEVPKGQTRTDWSRRPLSTEQIEYALDDVRHLLPLRDQLLGALERLGRLDWLAEECTTLERLDVLAVDADRAWLRFRGVEGWDEGRLRLLKALAAWRERRAVARNRPRGWILDDAVLREIVLQVPRTRDALAQVEGMPACPTLRRRCPSANDRIPRSSHAPSVWRRPRRRRPRNSGSRPNFWRRDGCSRTSPGGRIRRRCSAVGAPRCWRSGCARSAERAPPQQFNPPQGGAAAHCS